MALTKPTLNSISAWDVATGTTFTLSVVGGDQVTGSTLTIRNNATNAVVYTQYTTSYTFSITVPPNASGLSNGTYYNAYITTTNLAGDDSVASNTIQFYCFSTPSLTFTNVTDGGVINSSNLNATIEYDQDEEEFISSYVINLYDSSRDIIGTSGTVYVKAVASLPVEFSHLFGGLTDNTQYYISASCITRNNTMVETGQIEFTVVYTQSQSYTRFSVENNCNSGYVTVSSSAVAIDGIAQPSPAIFVNNNTMVYLNNPGDYVLYNDGFVINDNFTAKIWLESPNLGAPLLTMTNELGQKIIISIMVDYETSGEVFATLYVSGGYSIYTESIAELTDGYEYCVQVRRIDNLYTIDLEVVAI